VDPPPVLLVLDAVPALGTYSIREFVVPVRWVEMNDARVPIVATRQYEASD